MFSIIIPIKNQFTIIKKCIDSVIKHYEDQDIIIIDDGSTEIELAKYLSEVDDVFEHWKVLRNNESKGHTLACEQGIQNTLCENVFLLNSDTILTKNSIYILSDVLDSNSDIAVIGPKTSSTTGPQQSQEAYHNRFHWNIQQIEDYADQCEKLDSRPIDIDLVTGFCCGLKKSIFNEVGGFDKNLLCYGNEKELQIRIRQAGYRTCYVENSYVHHFGKMTYSQEKDLNIGRAQVDADLYIQKKHGSLK